MGLGLLLIPAIGGYWFLTHFNYTRYQAARDSGYHVLFRSAFAGLALFVLAYAIVLLLDYLLPQLGDRWDRYVPISYSAPAVLSVLLGVLLPGVANRFFDEEAAALKVARDNGDLVELLIADSIADQKLVELSLRNGKSYIGLGLVSGIGKSGDADIIIVPMASGYRHKDTQELAITTYYSPVIDQASDSLGLSYQDFRIVIPMSEIVSARLFFPEAYELFQETEETSPAEPPDGR